MLYSSTISTRGGEPAITLSQTIREEQAMSEMTLKQTSGLLSFSVISHSNTKVMLVLANAPQLQSASQGAMKTGAARYRVRFVS